MTDVVIVLAVFAAALACVVGSVVAVQRHQREVLRAAIAAELERYERERAAASHPDYLSGYIGPIESRRITDL